MRTIWTSISRPLACDFGLRALPDAGVPGQAIAATTLRLTLVVPLTLGHATLPALLDTGTDALAISPQAAARLGLAATGRTIVSGLKGAPVDGGSVSLQARLGPVPLGRVAAAIAPLPPGIAAIIGVMPLTDRRLILGFAPPACCSRTRRA